MRPGAGGLERRQDPGNKTEDGEVSIWKFAFSVIL